MNILKTRIVLVDRHEQSKVKNLTGKEPQRGDLDESIAAIVINLYAVDAIRQVYNLAGDLEPYRCEIFFGAEHYTVLTPYEEAVKLWLESWSMTERVTGDKKHLDVGIAVNTLTEALRQDPELHRGYHDNIAMAFYDTFKEMTSGYTGAAKMMDVQGCIQDGYIGKIANDAAKRFLNMFINSVNPKSDEK